VSQQKLNLLQFTASLMAQTGACTPEIVGRESRDLAVICFLLHDAPNDLGADAGSPDSFGLVDRTKEGSGGDSGGRCPNVNPGLYPIRDWNCSYVAALTDKISNHPVLLSLLDASLSEKQYKVIVVLKAMGPTSSAELAEKVSGLHIYGEGVWTEEKMITVLNDLRSVHLGDGSTEALVTQAADGLWAVNGI
jgi:hypothetical protein